VGDTLYLEGEPVEPLPGFKAAKPMVRPTLVAPLYVVCFVCVVRYAASLTTFGANTCRCSLVCIRRTVSRWTG
jgi:hypothetical protein